jgi:hypothetical protein
MDNHINKAFTQAQLINTENLNKETLTNKQKERLNKGQIDLKARDLYIKLYKAQTEEEKYNAKRELIMHFKEKREKKLTGI